MSKKKHKRSNETSEADVIAVGWAQVRDKLSHGLELTRNGASSLVRVFVDYSLPLNALGSWLGFWLSAVHARWCTRQMVMGAARQFN
ncbi:hypothetical protein [Roseateles sp.]|uniref:hypothetical protein n=1 Tax=Roseateles sp. TaxID=1971397 RepID=UPI0032675889